MNRQVAFALLIAAAVAFAPTTGAQVRSPLGDDWATTADRPGQAVDLVIALDTSDSMEPLIEAARLKLWEIVNAVALAEPPPRLRVALVTYGSPANDAAQGWVRVETDLTSDLDLVAERLFELETGGGREYVARVVQVALERLSWTPSHEALKLVFVAGNEPADQDPEVSLRSAGNAALDGGVVVNTLYCGRADQPDAATWRTLAEQSAGKFAAIDHRGGTQTLTTPYDDELARLGREINRTFVPLGESGRKRLRSIATQDENAARLGTATAAGRARTKSLPSYGSGWDLVAALDGGSLDLRDVDFTELPEDFQRLSVAQLETVLEDLHERRRELQQEIAELSALRRQHLVAQIEARGSDAAHGFDTAVQEMLRDELGLRGLEVAE